jgi:DpnII restriction endonuclease
MEQDAILEKLDEKIDRIASLRSQPRFSPQYKKWHRETEVLLQRVFGSGAYQVEDFKSIKFVFRGMHTLGDNRPFDQRFYAALDEAHAILTSIKEEILEFGFDSPEDVSANPVVVIETICSRFHSVVRQLRTRHSGRPTLDVEDEYDVQDLLHAILRIHFTDIRPEEWTPSYGGNSSRMDFLLKPERIVIEVKMTRRSMSDKDLVDQLIVDRGRYENHPDCEQLVCFVYDPDGRIGNPVAIISDLEATTSDLPCRVMIYPAHQ